MLLGVTLLFCCAAHGVPGQQPLDSFDFDVNRGFAGGPAHQPIVLQEVRRQHCC